MPDIAVDVKLSFLRWLVSEDQARQDKIRQYREYYDGAHDTQLTERQRQYLELKVGQEFNGNYCPIPVDSLAEKLTITGAKTTDDTQTEILNDWLTKNKLDGLQGIVHTCALRDGDSYIMVDWDEETQIPRFTEEMACCDGDGVKVHYQDGHRRKIDFATKRWCPKQGEAAGYIRRLNIYYPDRIEKYVSNQTASEGEWQPYVDEGETAWPIPWLRKDGSPIGVTVGHFKNKEQGYQYGDSELSDIIPLQNAYNKSLIDLLAAGDTTAFRVFTMVGDNPSGIKVAPGSWIYSMRPPGGDSGASIGHIPGEDLTPLIALKDSMATEIAKVSRTPLSYFQISGQVAAADTQEELKEAMYSKVQKRQTYFGNSWENALRHARVLWNEFGPGPELDETVAIEMVWKSPKPGLSKEDLEIFQIKLALGVPAKQIWAELGYTEEQIAEFEEMAQAEQMQQGNVGEMLLRAFERGGTPTQGAPGTTQRGTP